MLHGFLQNFEHNLFKPLLLFFYFGFLLPLLKVDFEFPYVIYQGVTMYLLLAIGWHGGEELATIQVASIGNIFGFIVLGFVLNFLIGLLAYLLLTRMTKMRRIDRATVAGYYGSDSAGTFATCVGVLATVGMAFNGFMSVMLAVMEIPGCLVALYLAARLREKGMDALGNMPDEPSYNPPARVGPGAANRLAIEQESKLALELPEHPDNSADDDDTQTRVGAITVRDSRDRRRPRLRPPHARPIRAGDLHPVRDTVRRCVIHRCARRPASGDPRGEPDPAAGRIIGFDVLVQRHDRDPGLHRNLAGRHAVVPLHLTRKSLRSG